MTTICIIIAIILLIAHFFIISSLNIRMIIFAIGMTLLLIGVYNYFSTIESTSSAYIQTSQCTCGCCK